MNRQGGAAVVEFALIVILLITLLFGMIELGRALFTWNSAVDATRRGARMASIAAIGDKDTVLAAMRLSMPELTAADVNIEYSTDGDFPGTACVRGTCRFVRVSVNYVFVPAVFFLPAKINMPPLYTTSPVEALGAT